MFKDKKHLKNSQQAVISIPEIYKFPISEDMDFIVMGCDGIWDCVDVQDMCEYISQKRKENIPLTKILKDLFGLFLSKHPDGNSKKLIQRKSVLIT
jgi:serine/threonine protein phosphatase PrpC